MADIVSPAPWRALDANGNPVAGAQARFFRQGTTTPLTVFSDVAGATPHPVPLVADSSGTFPAIFNTSAFNVKVDVTHPVTGSSLPGYPVDFARMSSTQTGAASTQTFAPTTDISETNTQAAIVRVQANWTSAKTGQDAGIVSGTPGTPGNLSIWNIDGDLVGGPEYGTSGANRLLQLNGSGALPAISGANLTNLPGRWIDIASVTTTSGTAFNVTGIPNGITGVDIFLRGISLSSNQYVLIQIGTGASPTETGYDGMFTNFEAGGSVTNNTGFAVTSPSAGQSFNGVVKLRRAPSTNQWMMDGMVNPSGTNSLNLMIGTVTLSGALNNIRVTRTGTGTFDAGSFAVRYRTA